MTVITATEGQTLNGAITNVSSLNANVDLFFAIGSSRGKDITNLFSDAFSENPEAATRILMWARDVRGGAGERQTFRDLLETIINNGETSIARAVMHKVPEIGRWDDLFVAFSTPLEREALRMISAALRERNALCAKWMPRKGPIANKIRSYLRLTPKQYRVLLKETGAVVEQKMCAGEWSDIEYGKLPSVASARYQKAFGRHDLNRYAQYIEDVQSGKDKVNAGAVYPYDITRSLKNGNVSMSDEQWKALPDYLNGATENILPVVDVSGSMICPASGSVQCFDVAVSLGLYLCERNTGLFKDTFVTFSSNPEAVRVSGDLSERYRQMSDANWGMTTNIQSVFEMILNSATMHNLPKEQMPSAIIILSDMEFDTCVRGDTSASMYDMARAKYATAGYDLPAIVFWNLNARRGNVPVRFTDEGTALVSGFSPSIMKSVLVNLSTPSMMTPLSIMIDTISDTRYDLEVF